MSDCYRCLYLSYKIVTRVKLDDGNIKCYLFEINLKLICLQVIEAC